MRRITTTSHSSLIAVLGAAGVLLAAPAAFAEQHAGGAGKAEGSMMATIHPVAEREGRVDEKMSFGTAKFSPGKDANKVDVLIQVTGVPLGEREAGPASDGAGATVPFDVSVMKSSDCVTAADAEVITKLPQLQVKDDGSGILMTTLEGVTMQQVGGQAVLVTVPGSKKNRVGCGVIEAKKG